MKNLFAKLGARVVSAWLFACWFGWRWLVALPALALLALAGRGAYADHVALAQLRAQLAAPQVAVIDPAALADAAKHGRKLGAPIYASAGNFIVQSFATSPYALGSNLTVTDSTTPAIQSGTSATSFSLGTGKAGAVLNLESGAASNTLALDESGAEGDAVFSYGGTPMLRLGHYSSGATYSAIWLNAAAATPSTSNFSLFAGSSYTTINGVGGNLYLAVSNLNYGTMTTTSFTMALPVTLGTTTGANTLDGSLAYTTRTVTASFTVDTTTTDNEIFADTSGGVFTVTLPAPTNGRVIRLVDQTGSWGTHNLTLARHGTETINGTAGNRTLSGSGTAGKWEVCTVTSDGTNWLTDCQ